EQDQNHARLGGEGVPTTPVVGPISQLKAGDIHASAAPALARDQLSAAGAAHAGTESLLPGALSMADAMGVMHGQSFRLIRLNPKKQTSTLRKLEALSSARLPRLLALNLAGVARQVAAVTQRRLELAVGRHQGAGQSQQDSPGLTGLAATMDPCEDVILAHRLGRFQRRHDVQPQPVGTEIGVGRLIVYEELATAGADADPRDRSLATARAPEVPASLHARLSRGLGYGGRRRGGIP